MSVAILLMLILALAGLIAFAFGLFQLFAAAMSSSGCTDQVPYAAWLIIGGAAAMLASITWAVVRWLL